MGGFENYNATLVLSHGIVHELLPKKKTNVIDSICGVQA